MWQRRRGDLVACGLQLDPMTWPVRDGEFLKTACQSHRVRTAVTYVYLKIEFKDIDEIT